MSNKSKKKPVFPDTPLGKVRAFWHFVWNDDSLVSWVLSIVIAFVIIKFVIYPLLGLILATSHPVVAVVSGSMEHKFAADTGAPHLCGVQGATGNVNLDEFWEACGAWYEDINLTKAEFETFSFKRGMNTGDIILIYGANNIGVGDVVVFNQVLQPGPNPIIHRVVDIGNVDGELYYQTKGDHNPRSALYEYNITEEQLIGRGVIRIPWLGYVKIWAVKLLGLF